MRHFFLAYLALFFGLGLTLSLWMLARQTAEREGRVRFDTRVKEIVDAIEIRMQTYVQTLYQTRGFVLTRGIPTQSEFATYIRSVNITENYPGIQGIGFTQKIAKDQLSSHIAAMQAQGAVDYNVHPQGDRDEYHSIIMLEPFDWRNQRAFGYDMRTNPIRQKAMDLARETGLPQITEIVTLVQETEADRQPGFLVYLPLYQSYIIPHTVEERRAKLLGYVYAPFRAHDLFQNIFAMPRPDMGIDFEIYDGSIARDRLLYDRNESFEAASKPLAQFSQILQLKMPGRDWIIYAHSLPAFQKRIANSIPHYVLGVGLLLSFLIHSLFLGHSIKVKNEHLLLTEARRELEERRRTEAELRTSEERLQQEMRSTKTLYKIGRTLAAELDLQRLLQSITDSASEAIGASFGAFLYHGVEESGKTLRLHTLSGIDHERFSCGLRPECTKLLNATFSSDGRVRLGDVTQDDRFQPQGSFHALLPDRPLIRSFLAVPVRTRSGLVVGALVFGHAQPEVFGSAAADLVGGIALQASVAIDNAALFQKAEDELLRRREAEDSLRTLNEELEARVRDRTAQLQAANHELEAFAYSVSHDLRAPLRGIDGFSSILERKYAASLDEQGQHYLKRVKDAASRMSHLIDDMLNLTRLSRQDMQKVRLDLSTLAHSVAKFLSESETKRQVEFHIHEGMRAHADPILMRAVLENLMGNAWKFTSQAQGAALIEIGMERREDQTLYYVKDNGAGFDMEYAEKLFRPFQRLHSTHEFPGSGIGLASVQRVIHRHGGKVWAEGRVNEGATFYFTLACSERNTQ